MTVTVAAETRISHSVARVSAAPAVAPRSLSRQVRDNKRSKIGYPPTELFHHWFLAVVRGLFNPSMYL